MTIDRDESGTVELEEMLEVLTDDVLDGDDPITKILILHKGADVNVKYAIPNICEHN
jgi:Ca2+-binding EF-hand superfamily protein